MELSIGFMAKSVGHSKRTCRTGAEVGEGQKVKGGVASVVVTWDARSLLR